MIIHNDCLEEMRQMADNCIDFIVCDPPYGLNFMGKKWDSAVPNISIWKEALRVCKPGSMLAAFGGSRTHHHLMVALEQAGWDVRDVIMWLYGAGFPKSHNFGRKLDELWHGYGTALKPAYEPIIICMKPLDGTFAQNAEKWGVAGINIDDSRIVTDELKPYSPGLHRHSPSSFNDDNWKGIEKIKEAPLGRWPANLILDEEVGVQLDIETKYLHCAGSSRNAKRECAKTGLFSLAGDGNRFGDSGGASRFFYCAKASSKERNAGCERLKIKKEVEHSHGRYRCKICCKLKLDHNPCRCLAPEFERIQVNQNNHPTVKPTALMKYIIKLLAPPGNPILLDPFMGSGSTLLAAQELGIQAIGIELSEEYCEIARHRLGAKERALFQEPDLFSDNCFLTASKIN